MFLEKEKLIEKQKLLINSLRSLDSETNNFVNQKNTIKSEELKSKIKNLSQDISKLKISLPENSNINQLMEEIQKLDGEIEQLSSEINKKTLEKNLISDEITKLNQEIASTNSEKNTQDEKVNQLLSLKNTAETNYTNEVNLQQSLQQSLDENKKQERSNLELKNTLNYEKSEAKNAYLNLENQLNSAKQDTQEYIKAKSVLSNCKNVKKTKPNHDCGSFQASVDNHQKAKDQKINDLTNKKTESEKAKNLKDAEFIEAEKNYNLSTVEKAKIEQKIQEKDAEIVILLSTKQSQTQNYNDALNKQQQISSSIDSLKKQAEQKSSLKKESEEIISEKNNMKTSKKDEKNKLITEKTDLSSLIAKEQEKQQIEVQFNNYIKLVEKIIEQENTKSTIETTLQSVNKRLKIVNEELIKENEKEFVFKIS